MPIEWVSTESEIGQDSKEMPQNRWYNNFFMFLGLLLDATNSICFENN